MPSVGMRRGGWGLCGLALGLLLAAQGVAPASAQAWAQCKYFSGLPDDCAGARYRKFDGLRGYRHEEIELFARDPLKKVLYVSIYDTTGLNGGEESRDSAPPELARRLDPKRIAKRYQALMARVGPVQVWTVDWLADRVGAARDFDGLSAAWRGNSLAPASALSPKAAAPYHVTFAARTAAMGFRKGSEVYLLDDPKDRTWVMVSFTNEKAPDLTVDTLRSLGDTLKLPPEWKFRAATLARELILEPKAGSTAAIEDDKGNIYHLTGPRQSNFVP